MKVEGIDTYSIVRITCEECGAAWLFAEHPDLEYADACDIAYCPFCSYEEKGCEDGRR